SKPSIDEERSYIAPAAQLDLQKLRSLWSELDQRAGKYFAEAGYERDAVTARYQMNMRYPGQNWALTFDISISKGLGDLSFVDARVGTQAIEAFNKRHMEEFGHIREGELPETTGVRLVTSVETPSPSVKRGFTARTAVAKAARQRRANLGAGYKQTDV